MGSQQSTPPGLTPEQAVVARKAYIKKCTTALSIPESEIDARVFDVQDNPMAILIRVDGQALLDALAKRLGFAVDPHYVLVTHQYSWKYGNEFLARLPLGDLEEIRQIAGKCCSDIGTWGMQQAKGKFYPGETAQNIIFRHANSESGDSGVLINSDHFFRGIIQEPDFATVNEEIDCRGPLFEPDTYWPQYFMQVFYMFPLEYEVLACGAVRNLSFANEVKKINPLFISDPNRLSYLKNEAFLTEIERLKSLEPTCIKRDGITLDLRLRKEGKALDFVLSGRCMAPVFLSLESAFDKASVPTGTVVSFESEKGDCHLTFYCERDGKPITPETAHFFVEPLAFSDAEAMRRMTEMENGGSHDDTPAAGENVGIDDGAVMNNLTAAQKREYCFMPSATLYEELGLIRMMHAEIYAPAPLLAGLIHQIRALVNERQDNDWGAHPLILPIFTTKATCGYTEDLEKVPAPDKAGTEYTFRFLCSDLEYFEDRRILNDDGEFELLDGSDDDDEESSSSEEEGERVTKKKKTD